MKKTTIKLIALCVALIACPAFAAQTPTMRQAFWARNWKAMDSINAEVESKSADLVPTQLSMMEASLYLNGLWIQGRYQEGLALLEKLERDGREFPDELKPYATMLRILGLERTDRKAEARELGKNLWEASPHPVKYYLAYANARTARDIGDNADSIAWFRRMLELAPDKKRRVQALSQMINLTGVTPDEAATLLVDSPSNAKALAACKALPSGSNAKVDYAVGYNAYINKKYDEAMTRFNLAWADPVYGEAARYYRAYAAYREKRNETALKLWSDIALSDSEFPQRSVARLTTLAGRGYKPQILALFKKVASTRTDYPELAADALVGIIRLGEGVDVSEAEKKLFSDYASTNQAATARWEKGWREWKNGNFKAAHDHWSSGYSPEIKNRELAARLLYWQSRALKKLNSPEAEARVKRQLVEAYPAEYYTFLVAPDGGIVDAQVPKSYDRTSMLEDWGFVTYARLEAAGDALQLADVPTLYRAIRLSLWEGDYTASVRAFSILQRHIPANELASSGLLKYYYPRAYESDVEAASKKTGLGKPVIWSIMRQESLYEPDVTSTAGAYGLMQLMPATARSEAKKMKMDSNAFRTPTNNIMLGANHFVGLMAAFKQQTPLALAAYNAGGTPVRRWSEGGISDMAEWVEDIGYRETRGYVKAVLRNIEVYKRLYEKKSQGESK